MQHGVLMMHYITSSVIRPRTYINNNLVISLRRSFGVSGWLFKDF